MCSIIGATQRERRRGLAWNWCVCRDVHPNKIIPEWIYNANTKGPWSETRGPGIGGATGATCSWTVTIGYSNPYLKAAYRMWLRKFFVRGQNRGQNYLFFNLPNLNNHLNLASGGAVRRMRTRIGLLVQPKSMRSTTGTTQREQRHSLLKWGTFLIRTRCK